MSHHKRRLANRRLPPTQRFRHAVERAQERYGIDLADDVLLDTIVETCLAREPEKISRGVEIHCLPHNDTTVIVAFLRPEKGIVTVLPPSAREESGRLRVKK